ncbi:MAG: PHP domain-containing protein [Deltaproteobacteria bacterium]|jgi:predicted metal-dependent phosphoesterase TrpH|nr:PHP domain-containing protein [Deltaproteobacteria bacterium]
MKRLDLHTHSTASDGTFRPSEVALLAQAFGLAGAALCDHDTVEGLDEFMDAGRRLNFTTIGGVELSLQHVGTTHLLGLGVSADGRVPPALEAVKGYRQERNRRLFERLVQLGYQISWERVEEIAGQGQMGRPHFARALVEAGFFGDLQEAFNRLLAKGQPAYVDKIRHAPRTALELLRRSGFAPVLAHPVSLKLEAARWPQMLSQWKDWGLVGLEAYHPDQGPEFTAFLLGLAKRCGLTVTAGSDYHGANKKTPLSWVKERSPLGLEVLERLRAALDA